MIIFQTAGCGCAGGLELKPGLLADTDAHSTTFRTNDYIHRLNRTLQAEMRALSAYTSLTEQRSPPMDSGVEAHHLAGRELVRLIIANRGVPEDRAALSLGITKRLIQFCTLVPTRLTERVTVTTLRQLERVLIAHYQKLLTIAPGRDRDDLEQLLARALEQLSALSL